MPKREFDEKVENQLSKIVVDHEYQTAKTNQTNERSDFEHYIDLFDAERNEKEYDWMSDIFIPEFPSHMLTQSAIDVSQYFQTRDFIEVYIEDESPQTLAAADATKELVNRTLNRRDLYHYMKFVRAKNINHLGGHVDAHCWWEQDVEEVVQYGPFGEETNRQQIVHKDQFNYEILDPRNVFTDSAYHYSMQDREFVIIRFERTVEKLKQETTTHNYFNLHLLEEDGISSDTEKTETHQETVEADTGTNKEHPANKMGKRFDIFKRFGEFWITKNGKPGINEDGDVVKGAVLEEMIMTFAVSGTTKTLIGFHPTPNIDANGNPFKPIIRGLCYIHPTKDAGVGDGKYASELQVGLNDTVNVSNDRVMQATMPTMKGKKYSTEDNDTIYMEPGHLMELENTDDIEEVIIRDNIAGAMSQAAFFTEKMQQATAISPGAMGQLPPNSSMPATLGTIAENRTNQRTNYKSMTFEYTFLVELYWMIQQMTWRFAKPETGFKLMGKKVYDFDPSLNYTYKPLSQSIESSHSKSAKITQWNQTLGYLVPMIESKPSVVKAINYIIIQIAKLQGDEFTNFAHTFLGPETPTSEGNQANQPGAIEGGGASNQFGIPQSAIETGARQEARMGG